MTGPILVEEKRLGYCNECRHPLSVGEHHCCATPCECKECHRSWEEKLTRSKPESLGDAADMRREA